MLNRDNLLRRAEFLRRQKRLKEAEREVGVVLQSNPEDVEALIILGHCKIDARLFDEAIVILKQCLQFDSSKDYIFYLLSFTYYQKSDSKNALNYLKEALSIFPYNPGYFALAAHIHLDDKDYQSALAAADTGLSIDAENVSCLNARSTALFRLNKKDEARDSIHEALSIDPENYITHTNYGWHHLEKGRHKDAEVHFKEALRINPNYAYAKQGYKSALKSKLIFYKWLLQSNLWLSQQSKKLRMGIIFGLWLLVAGINTAAENSPFQYFCYSVMLVYFAIVIFSWIGSSLANLYLLATPHGHYILSNQEKWSARMVGISLILSLLLLGLVQYFNSNYLFVVGVVACFTLIFNEIDFPIKPFRVKGRALFSHIILTTGLLCCLVACFSLPIATWIAIVYGFLFVGFIWSGSIRSTI